MVFLRINQLRELIVLYFLNPFSLFDIETHLSRSLQESNRRSRNAIFQ